MGQAPSYASTPIPVKVSSHGNSSRDWARRLFRLVAVTDGDKTRSQNEARTKAICFPCSTKRQEPVYLTSKRETDYDFAEHMKNYHSELKNAEQSGTSSINLA